MICRSEAAGRPRGLVAGAAALLASSLAVAPPAPAQEEPAGAEPRTIPVEDGDTLWGLARRHLGGAHRWQELYRANAERLSSPDRLRPGMRLVLPDAAGAAPASGEDAPAEAAQSPAEAGRTRPGRAQEPSRPRPAESLFGREERVLGGGLRLDAPAPPSRVTDSEFARAPFLVDRTEAPLPGRTMGRVERSPTPTELPVSVVSYDRVRVDAGRGTLRPGDLLQAFHWGERLSPGRTVARPVALLRVEAVTGDGAVARVASRYGLYRVGDPVVTLPDPPDLEGGRLEPVADGLTAAVIGPSLERPMVRPGSMLFLEAGREQGVRPGDEFVAPTSGPGEATVRLRVIRTDARTSTVRVMNLRDPHLEPGAEARLVRRLVSDGEG